MNVKYIDLAFSPLHNLCRRQTSLLFVCFFGLLAGVAHAQIIPSELESAVSALAGANTVLATVTVPSEILQGLQGSPQWSLNRGSVLLYAADVAKHNSFPRRSAQLYQEAITSLTSARQGGLSGSQASQCDYFLGYVAERVDNNLTAAQSYYEQAIASDSTNKRAVTALTRVQIYLARIARQ